MRNKPQLYLYWYLKPFVRHIVSHIINSISLRGNKGHGQVIVK